MSTTVTPSQRPEIEYPDCDGQPVSDNTLQFKWIVTIKEGLEALFRNNPDVFVAGDLLWYAEEGKPKIRTAPDAMVAFGRPKGYRGSYKQWVEGGIAPQVVFEVRDFLRCGGQSRTVSPVDVTTVIASQLTYCVEVAAELLADVEEQTVRSVHQAQRPGRESPRGSLSWQPAVRDNP